MIYFNKLVDICINRYESQKVVDNYFDGTNKNISIKDKIGETLNVRKNKFARRCKKIKKRRKRKISTRIKRIYIRNGEVLANWTSFM